MMANRINLRSGIISAINNPIWKFLKVKNTHSLLNLATEFLIPDQEISDSFKLKQERQRNLFTSLCPIIKSGLA